MTYTKKYAVLAISCWLLAFTCPVKANGYSLLAGGYYNYEPGYIAGVYNYELCSFGYQPCSFGYQPLTFNYPSDAYNFPFFPVIFPADTPSHANDTLPYPFFDQSGTVNPLYNPDGGLMLSTPPNIKTDVEYNDQTGQYDIYQKIGSMDYRIPTEMDSDQYQDYMYHKAEKDYFQQKAGENSSTSAKKKQLIPPIKIGSQLFADIFGGNEVNIIPQGSAELTFGFNNSKMENPALPVIQRSITTFNFDENIQLSVTGKIGTKLNLTINYNTKATFDFQNQMKLQFFGKEDDIIKEIDAGNVTFTLPGTLITGSQSLFGVKTKLQFGRLTSTTVYAQEKGQKKTITVQNGSQSTNFNIKCDQYMANQHYFLSQYFQANYNAAVAHPPIVSTPITITRVEVWVTNTNSATQNTRDVLAFSDLGESEPNFTEKNHGPVKLNTGPGYLYTNPSALYLPSDSVNSLDPYILEKNNRGVAGPTTAISSLISAGFQQVTDFEKVDLARMLSPSEYTLNPKLGYISLKQPLIYAQVLAVAYQYTYNGKTYQVGQFSTYGVPTTNELVVKMLKSSNVSPTVPIWNLMMKNIYSLGAYQINPQNFLLNIWYSNAATGVDIPYLPEGNIKGQQLLRVEGLDQLDQEGDPVSDGLFDFLPGIDIDPTNGYIIFESTEPFGTYLNTKLIASGDQAIAKNYVFQALYDSFLVVAQQIPTLDRYWLRGSFQSSASSDINLGAMNIPQGSVIVTAGGIKLTENVDYTVDYTLGRVKILNQGLLSSGTPISVSLENNALFSIESKTFFGQHFDYLVSKDFNLGATVVNYTEHPLTQIVSIGQEPVSNTMIGLNGDYKKQAPWLTHLIDDLPGIYTKAPSEITASSEVAAMIPGHPKYIGSTGNAYIDDFEGSESFIDISQPTNWSIASTPQGQPAAFPEGQYFNDLRSRFNCAKLAWYVVDPLFQQSESGITPSNETTTEMSNNYVRMVLQTEIFPQEQSATGTPINLPVLNLAFYPYMRGPYNYDALGSNVSEGVTSTGYFSKSSEPSRWGGIMRPLQETDFLTDNIQFIEFWMMDPYNQDDTTESPNGQPYQPSSGSLYFDLGSVSEDVLRDGQKSFENGLPTDQADQADSANINNPWVTTRWGHVPVNPSLVNAFNNNDATYPFQDIGLDGLSDAQEQTFFASYLNQIKSKYGAGSQAYQMANSDPSTDDYNYYRDDRYDNAHLSVLDRYLKYNGMEGNSGTSLQYQNQNPAGGDYPTTESTLPNTEDINQDNTLEQAEAYYEYQVKMDPNSVSPGNVGNNYITSVFQTTVTTANGTTRPIKWYQFKIPIESYERKVGQISDFNSIQYIRMYLKGFNAPIICRFGQLELVRDEWRTYDGSLLTPGDYVTGENNTIFNQFGVNLQENSNTTPVNYVIPPGIQRQLNLQSANLVQLNEGSLALNVCDLVSGDARAVTKNVQLDLRAYKTLNMFIHCQSSDPAHPLKNGDVQGFIRLGSDFTQNYYEYAIPLQVTPPGSYNTNNPNDQTSVWPTADQVQVALATLENAKLARDAAMETNSQITLQTPYYVNDGVNVITIVGNPTISSVQEIMLGVRNPKRTVANAATNNGLPKCAQVWFDELRMSDFSEKGGWATISRVTAKLADLGTLSIAGNVSTPGFGTLEANVGNLSRETDEGYSISTNLEMGKFLPQSWNITIPAYMSFSDQYVIPEYNPLDPDILLSNTLSTLNKAGQDSIRDIVISRTIERSLNFTNVHKNKGKNKKKSYFWDIENFTGSYAFTSKDYHDVNNVLNQSKTYKGGLIYSYSLHPKAIQPLAKSDFFRKRKYLSFISDFNFYPAPDKFTVSEYLDREYSAFQLRNTLPETEGIEMPVAVNRVFNVTRTYNLTFPLAKSLRFIYSATNDSRVMEPEGVPITNSQQRDSVRNDFFNHQVNTDFHQSAGLNYEVPIKKIPFLDFVSLTASYTGTYQWMHAPFAADSIGGTIQNTRTDQLNGSFSMTTLYNKVGFIKEMLQEQNQNQQKPPNLAMARGNKRKPDTNAFKKPEDSIHGADYYVEKYFIHLLTSIKNISFTFSDNRGMMLPNYNQNSSFLGMSGINGGNPDNWAPGLPFVFGSQYNPKTPFAFNNAFNNSNPYIQEVQQNGWLEPLVNNYTPFTTVHTQTFSMRASLEPIPDLKIELSATRTYSQNSSQYIHANVDTGNTYTETGNFSMSYLSFKTIFQGRSLYSNLFNNYLSYRTIISQRQALSNPNSSRTYYGPGNDSVGASLYDGYSRLSQNVAIPAFLAAYSGQNPNKITLNPFPAIPYPNWTLTYNAYKPLSSLFPWIKNNISSIIFSNAYTSTYSIASYNFNELFGTDADGFPNVRDLNGDFLPRDQIPTVSIMDGFSPLVKIAITFKSNVSSNFEVSVNRQAALNMSDLTVDEVYASEYVLGLGYKIKNVTFPIKIGTKPIKNDLTLRADLSIRQNETFIRNSLDLSNEITGGQQIISIKSQAEYNISTRVTIRLYFDKVINNPYISSTFPTSTMDGGFAIRFSLS